MKRLFITISSLLVMLVFIMPTIAQTCDTQVKVQRGDTLWDIARRCGTTVPAILEFNGSIFEPSVINVGELISIPTNEEARPPQVNVYPQSVQPGDRIQIIANGFPLTTDVQIAAGQDGSEFAVSQIAETDNQGALYATLVIPPTVDFNERWVVIVETLEGQIYKARSFPFFIDEETVRPPAPQATNPPNNLFTQTQIYLVALGTGGTLGCGDSLVPYTVSIEPTVAPLTAALTQLFTIGEQPYGYHNALGQSNLRVRGIDIVDGVAEIDLTGELNVAGVCDLPRIQAQLQQTALQYSTIDSTKIFVNGQPLANLLSQR